jgi:putative ABC transport system permease protein
MRSVVLRGLLARRLRLVLTSLAIALGVMLISGSYIFTDTFTHSFDKIFSASYKGVDVSITPHVAVEADQNDFEPPIPASVLAKVKAVPGVASAQGAIFDQSATILNKQGKTFHTGGAPQFLGSASANPRFDVFQYVSGHKPASGDQLALDKATADKEHFKLGDKISVQSDTGRRSYDLVGIVKLGGVDSFGGASVALLTLPAAQKATGKVGQFDSISAASTPGTNADVLSARIRAALPRTVEVRTGQQQAAKQSNDIRDNLSFLTTALLSFAGIALFVGAFLIFNTFSITVAQRMREMALLRTLGATRRQIRVSVLSEGLVLGVLGSLIGIGLGVLAAIGLKALFHAIGFDVPSSGMVIESRTIIVSILVGVLVTLAATLAPALRATRVPPIAALREGAVLPKGRGQRWSIPIAVLITVVGIGLMVAGLFAISDSGQAVSALGLGAALVFIGVALLSPKLVGPIASVVGRPIQRVGGISGRLARENVVRQPGRTAVTAAALMVGVALVTFASVFAASANKTVSAAIDSRLTGQAVIQNNNGFSSFSADATRAAGQVPGVAKIAALRSSAGRLTPDGSKADVRGVDPATFSSLYRLPISSGPADAVSQLGLDGTVLDKDFAKSHKLKVGSRFSLRTPTDQVVGLHVVGLSDDSTGVSTDVMISNALIQSRFGVNRDDIVFVGYAPGSDDKAVTARLKAALEREFPETDTLTNKEFKDQQAGQINQLLGIIFALLGLAIIVSLFGIVNTLVLSITERTRELALLRAIGTSRRQVRRMIRGESVIIAMIGSILGTVLGVALAVLVSRPLHDLKFAFPVGSIIIVLILGALAGVFAAIWPARRASKLDVLASLSYE